MYEITCLQLPHHSQHGPMSIRLYGIGDLKYTELPGKIFLDELPSIIEALQIIIENQQALKESQAEEALSLADSEEQEDNGEKQNVQIHFTRDDKWIGRKVRLRNGELRTIVDIHPSPDDFVELNGSGGDHWYYDGGYFSIGESDLDVVEILPEEA